MVLRNQNDLLKIVLVSIVVSYYFFIFIQQVSLILDQAFLHEEQRQLFSYYQLNDPRLFKDDYITSFLISGSRPVLYDFFTRTWLSLGGGLLGFHSVMPITLWALLLASAALSGWKLKGASGSLGTFGLVLTQPLFLHQISSAIPHAFAFPLLGWTIAALLYNSLMGMVVLTLLSCVLYPIVTPAIGLLLVGSLMFSYKGELCRFEKAAIFKVMAIAGITGLLSILLGMGVLQPHEGYGEPLAPYQEVELFPENGMNGRYSTFFGNTEALLYVAVKFSMQFKEGFGIEMRLMLTLVYFGLAFLGYFAIAPKSSARKRVALYVVVNLVIALLFFAFKPYYAYRFLLYPFLLGLAILVPVEVIKIFSGSKKSVGRGYSPILVLFLFTLTLDGTNQSQMGYQFQIDEETNEILEFVQTLPADTLIAGWPGFNEENVSELIPYLAKRRVLVLGKVHVPTYKDYILNMREKMYALIEAYSASGAAPIRKLNNRFGVRYLLVDKRHFSEGNPRPTYFAPFNDYIDEVWGINEKKGFLLAETDIPGIVFQSENYYILNITEFLKK